MELRQLETFVSVLTNRSFTRAANDLSLTQPAVTRQIAALERELKTRLLERMGRRVAPTQAGEALLTYALEILRLASEADRAVRDIATGGAGKLAVGASSTTAAYILPRLLSAFRARTPGVEISVHTGPSAQVALMVMANEVDLGVVTSPGARTGLSEIPLAEFATCVVVYPGHPLSSRNTADRCLTAEELAGNPLILMEEGTNLRTYVDRLLSAAGVQERVTMELDNVEAIKKMIEARLGISLLPRIAVKGEVEAGSLIALPLEDAPGSRRTISLIHRTDKYVTSAMAALMELIIDSFTAGR